MQVAWIHTWRINAEPQQHPSPDAKARWRMAAGRFRVSPQEMADDPITKPINS